MWLKAGTLKLRGMNEGFVNGRYLLRRGEDVLYSLLIFLEMRNYMEQYFSKETAYC